MSTSFHTAFINRDHSAAGKGGWEDLCDASVPRFEMRQDDERERVRLVWEYEKEDGNKNWNQKAGDTAERLSCFDRARYACDELREASAALGWRR